MSGASNETSSPSGGHALSEGAVWKAIFIMAGPMLFGIAAIKSVSIVDTFYVGQLGETELAALSFAFPITTIIIGLALGLSIGASSVVSRAVGEGDNSRAKTVSLHDLILAVLVSCVIGLVGALVTRPLFELIGASGETLDDITQYMRIWFIAVPFLMIGMMCDFIVRATGNSLWPSLIMSTGALFNIGITGLLVFGIWGLPEFGIIGAALGTLIAKVFTAGAGIWLVTWKAKMVHWQWPKLSELWPCWIATFKVGGPAALGNMVHPFTLTLITAMLAGFSENTVAAYGVATQVQMIGFIPLLALSAAVSPIAGQNWGAGRVDRVITCLRQSYWLCLIWCVLISVALWIYGGDFATLFNDDNDIPAEAQRYLRIVPMSLFGYGMVICAAAAFNGIDHANRALGFNIVRSLLLFLPLSWVGSMMADSTGVYAGIAAGNILSGLGVGWYAIHWLQSCDHDSEEVEQKSDAHPVPAE